MNFPLKIQILLFVQLCILPFAAQSYSHEDIAVFERYRSQYDADSNSLIRTAIFFVNTPYVSGTLEQNQKEQLVVNFHQLDCSTFIEVAAAFYLSSGSEQTIDSIASVLQKIRYRNRIVSGYLSRLHYFCDWITENEKQGLFSDQTESIGGVPFQCERNFMSTYPEKYCQLRKNPEMITKIRMQEERINKKNYFFIPKQHLKKVESQIQDGDIIAMTTTIQGLDISHVGFALRNSQNKELHLLHASSIEKKVVISEQTLDLYLSAHPKISGIMLLRLKRNTK